MGIMRRRTFLASTAAAALAGRVPLAVAADPAAEDALACAEALLRPAPLVLSPSQNALPLLIEAGRLLTDDEPDGDFVAEDCFNPVRPDAERDRAVAAWIEANRRSLDLVEAAVGRAGLEYPHEPWADERLKTMMRLRALARLLAYQGQRLMWQRDFASAARTSLALERASRLLLGGGGVVVEHIVGSASNGTACSLIQRISQHPGADAPTLRTMLAGLAAGAGALAGMRKAIRAEYSFYIVPELERLKDADTRTILESLAPWDENLAFMVPRSEYDLRLEKLSQLFCGHPNAFDAEDTRRRAVAQYATWIHELDLSWAAHQARPDPAPTAELAAWPEQLATSLFGNGKAGELSETELATARKRLRCVDNPIGKQFLEQTLLESKALHRSALAAEAQHAGTRLLLATRAYKLERGELPPTLESLVEATILEALPMDPFTDKPFRYSREERAIWSVGPDGDVSPDASPDDVVYADSLIWRLE
ncbi:MAG: hypothetical protein DWQ37_06780 [Planctomycetota bacterium]|nr:MAG: hypothetical protein DWQ37_06780 [Planctomycetota bacterium]